MKKIVLALSFLAGLGMSSGANADYCDKAESCFKIATECAGYADCS